MNGSLNPAMAGSGSSGTCLSACDAQAGSNPARQAGWKAPADGGKPKAYKVQRRLRDSGDWKDIATAIITEATLVAHPEKTELEPVCVPVCVRRTGRRSRTGRYRVIAVNKFGEGQASNMVMAVL